MNSFSLRIHGYIQPCICLGKGRVQQRFTFLVLYIKKIRGIIMFGTFLCGTYVILVVNFNIVIFLNLRNLSLIGWAIFSIILSNSSSFLCGVTVFRIPLACVYFCYKTDDSVILCPAAVLDVLIVSKSQARKVYQTIFP